MKLTSCSQTCKRRHTRCDERKPTCGNCERLNLDCEQVDIIWKLTPALPSPAETTQEEPSLLKVFRSEFQTLGRFAEANTLATDLMTPPVTDGTTPLSELLTSETAFLLQTYTRTVATWMDLFDFTSIYQLRIPRLVLTSPLLFHCVCAFSANHLALSNASSNPSWKLVAVKHYGEALRLLIQALSMPNHEHALTASMILLSYEIHGAQRSEDYRRHFLGLTTLIRSRNITAQCTGKQIGEASIHNSNAYLTSGTERANFWIYVRHEIALALASEQPLVLDPSLWAVSWKQGETREDVLGNHVLWILARVLNLIFGKDGTTTAGKYKRKEFLHELKTWRSGLSLTFVGVPHGEADEDGFQKVYCKCYKCCFYSSYSKKTLLLPLD